MEEASWKPIAPDKRNEQSEPTFHIKELKSYRLGYVQHKSFLFYRGWGQLCRLTAALQAGGPIKPAGDASYLRSAGGAFHRRHPREVRQLALLSRLVDASITAAAGSLEKVAACPESRQSAWIPELRPRCAPEWLNARRDKTKYGPSDRYDIRRGREQQTAPWKDPGSCCFVRACRRGRYSGRVK